MRTLALLGGAAIAAVAIASPATAQLDGPGIPGEGDVGLNVGLTYVNEVVARSNTSVSFNKDVALEGSVNLDGDIDVNHAAVATVDNKQLLTGNTLVFSEENELNGENGYVDSVFGGSRDEDFNGDGVPDGITPGQDTNLDQIRVGYFAPVINTINPVDINGEGNIGVNLAAGYYNLQENIAALAVATFDVDDDETGGWAEASLTSLQAATLNIYAPDPFSAAPEDDPEEGGSLNDFRVRNTTVMGNIDGAGNIGVNAATGAFNLQKNAMVLAVATDASLAEANAAVIQASSFNYADIQDEQNLVDAGVIGGAGNIGVNLAAGVGNQQHNSLIIATSTGGAANNGGNAGNGGDAS